MAAKHIEVARTQGAKAGFNAYIEALERSGLPQVQASLAEVRAAGNKKAQFDFYCQKYGAKFGQASVQAAPESDEITTLREQVESLLARISQVSKPVAAVKVEGGRSGTRVETPRKSAGAQKNAQFRAWAVRKHNIPVKVGAKFSYTGKHATTQFQVVKVTGKGDTLLVECARI